MERNAIIAAALSLAVLLVWQYLVLRPAEDQRARERQAQQQAVQKPKEAPRPEPPVPAAPQPPAGAKPGEPLAAAEKERRVRVDVGVAVYEFTSRGAGLTSAALKDYPTKENKPVELAPGGSPRLRPLYFWGGQAAERLNAATFRVEGEGLRLGPGNPSGEIRFVYRAEDGLSAVKTLTFHHGRYHAELRVRVEGAQGPIGVALGPDIGGSDGNTYGGVIEGPMSYVGKKLHYDYPEAGKPAAHKGEVRWAALQSKHFLMALVPRAGAQDVEALLLGQKDGKNEYAVVLPLAGQEARFDFYAGPKEPERMAALNVSLEDSLDYGIFSFIAKPLMMVLRAFHTVSGNWGVAIILLTVLVKIIFYPLTHMSMRNMKEMQKLQPRMEQLRELYKDDRARLNEQVMALYRERKVNPMMGCLPMIIQIPVFFGLYEALLVSIELRHAPFFAWVQDLSAPEPWPVYTVLMGLSMYLQQKMSPAPADPAQAKMMMFMPVIFTGMFVYYPVPAGLVIYWLVNNILSIAQQYYVNRSVKPPRLAEEKG
ncbi:MAG: membrane protein insertase YidC [Candidatus Tectomicrobia bacterium]|uniref:Membrane protein insertase YidC n=1 Tax=Tectimicrobiota bacterium TaxID=2528274 RepID=A0A932I0B3_UNCTE|nr:membrane protein insertase YidC [Candidatus Tectomicrobia bacterium]